MNGALPIVRGNEIRNNSLAGLSDPDLTVHVDAVDNWWGAASGPHHPTLNTTGTGNEVSDGVDFCPVVRGVGVGGALHRGRPRHAHVGVAGVPTGSNRLDGQRGAPRRRGLAVPGQRAAAYWKPGTVDQQALADGSYNLHVQFYAAGPQLWPSGENAPAGCWC